MTASRPLRCLLVYVEPTPYIVPLVRALTRDPRLVLEPWYLTRDMSQSWGADIEGAGGLVIGPPGDSGILRARRVFELLSRIMRGHFQVAHLAGWGRPLLILIMVSLRLRGVPFSLESDTQLNERRNLKYWIKSATYPFLLRLPHMALPGGSRQARFFRHYGLPETRIRIAFMTSDITRLKEVETESRNSWRKRWGIADEEFIFLFVGRLESLKGLEDLIEAFERVAPQLPTSRLVIVGDGSLRDVVARASRALDSIILIDRQPMVGVLQWMRSADALVVPSRSDQWGLVVNEGMSSGLPIVSTDRVGAVDDLVRDGENGLIVPGENPEALAQAMLSLAQEPDRARAMGVRSEELIRDWTIEREAGVIATALVDMVERP